MKDIIIDLDKPYKWVKGIKDNITIFKKESYAITIPEEIESPQEAEEIGQSVGSAILMSQFEDRWTDTMYGSACYEPFRKISKQKSMKERKRVYRKKQSRKYHA